MKRSYHQPITFFSLLFISILFISCGNTHRSSPNEKLKVISSFSIITDMTQEIGKDSVEVHNLVPIGTDPHEYSPVPEDIKFASKADIYFYNGLNLEGGERGWFFKLIHSIGADPSKVVQIAKEVQPMYLTHKGGKKEINPHAFISPKVGLVMAKEIEKALITADPESQAYYKKNAQAYIANLQDMEKEYRKKLGELPEDHKVFIASEQAFQYLNAEYGLKEGYIWAIDTDENGSPDQIKSAIAFVKKNNPPVLFVESNVDRRPMETVSHETGIPIYNPAIFSDELGKPGQEADTYIGYLAYNLKHLYNGLK